MDGSGLSQPCSAVDPIRRNVAPYLLDGQPELFGVVLGSIRSRSTFGLRKSARTGGTLHFVMS
uniref:Uncharacterized protein n=1 Tax=Arundo donax TaxID=35708 RepID=A0A0A8YHT5_ARUDO